MNEHERFPSASIGIDPGLDGYIAGISDEGKVWTEPIPTVSIGKKREYDMQGLRRFLCLHRSAFMTMEKQQAMPKQGVVSSFRLGKGYGILLGLLAGLGIRYSVVHPRTWKAKMLRDIPGDDQKGRSIIAAQRLFPDVDLRRTPRCKKNSHDKAESLLLAEYGRYNGNEGRSK